MGIELPVELRGLAARVGAHWPEADEDAMRRSADAWRETAKSVGKLARDADAAAGAALGAFEGEAAEAAREYWNGFVAPDTGDLPVSIEGCTASADRLDHAADQVAAAKVRIVRELVALSKNTGAAEQAAAAGHPRALAGVETLLRSTSASLAGIHATLTEAVDIDSGVRMDADAGDPAGGLSAGESSGGGVERTGPVAAEAVAGADGRSAGSTEAGTGPIPVVGAGRTDAQPVTGTAVNRDSASTTAPHAVHQAWAAPPAAGGAPQGGPGAAAGPSPVGYGRGWQHHSDGGSVAPGPARPPGAPPAASARPPAGGVPVSGPPAAPGHQQAPPRGAFRPGGTPLAPASPPQQPPQQAPPPQRAEVPQRPLRQSERNSTVVAFVLHQFPIGHMPVAASRPSRQWSVSADDSEVGLRFPPRDHPRSGLVEDADALARVRSGDARRGATESGGKSPVGEVRRAPEELFAGYDPLGADHGLSEVEWEHRYLRLRASADRRGEYVWPAYSGFPEGGLEPGEPIVLTEDTIVDHFGDAWGRVLSAAATAFAERCLPPEYADRNYRRYRVMRPLPVWQAISASWFAQPGGGARYRGTHPVGELVALGYLVELAGEDATRQQQDSETRTLRIGTTPTASRDLENGPSGVAAESRQEAQ